MLWTNYFKGSRTKALRSEHKPPLSCSTMYVSCIGESRVLTFPRSRTPSRSSLRTLQLSYGRRLSTKSLTWSIVNRRWRNWEESWPLVRTVSSAPRPINRAQSIRSSSQSRGGDRVQEPALPTIQLCQGSPSRHRHQCHARSIQNSRTDCGYKRARVRWRLFHGL